jgi:hypothetical protein
VTAAARTAAVATSVAVTLALAGCSGDEGARGDKAATDSVTCVDGTVGEAGGPAEDDARVTGYDADLAITGKGGLRGHESITVEYDDGGHHDIYRDFDDDDFTLTDVTAELDGTTSAQVGPGPSGTRVTIGDPEVALDPGEHVVDIAYRASNAIAPADDGGQTGRFAANVIGAGWALDIEDAVIRIHLPPGTSGDVACTVGDGASAHIDGAGTSTLVLTADEVPAGSGVRVVAEVAPYPGEAASP